MTTTHSGPAAAAAASADDGDLLARVSAEFREMPGLAITLDQAARLFAVDHSRCERILAFLVRGGVLSTDGRVFARAGTGRRSI